MSDDDLRDVGIPQCKIQTWFKNDAYSEDIQSGMPDIGVECGRGWLSIPRNLFQYFDEEYRRTQDDGSHELGVYTWADSICINQEDFKERNVQVAMMGDIYASASGTLLWLGSNTTDLEVALPGMALIHDILANHDLASASQESPRDESCLQAIGINTPEEDWFYVWDTFYRFLERRRYFYRAWVSQECGLSNCITIRCGHIDFPFERLKRVWGLIAEAGWALHITSFKTDGYYSIFHNLIENGMSHCNTDIRCYQYPINDFERSEQHVWYGYLSYLLRQIRRAVCIDERDKVFAVLGMVNRASRQELSKPDYSMTVPKVYLWISRELTIRRPGLTVLYHREESRDPHTRKGGLIP